MAAHTALGEGNWGGFDRYEMRAHALAPAPGAKFRIYDPWKLAERPYKSLIQIVTRRPPKEVLTLPAEQPELVAEILDWVRRYGLLGTLYHRTVMVSLWPRWERVEFADKLPRDYFNPTQQIHLFSPGAWQSKTINHASHVIRDESRLGSPLTSDELPPDSRTPGALVVDWDDADVREEPLDKTWAAHFPDVPYGQRQTYPYPHPVTREFWELYGEPVSEFVTAAWMLANGIDAVTRPANRQAPDLGIIRLARLASFGTPFLVRERSGGFRQRWRAGSLLSALAVMAMEDISKNLLHQCQTCRTFFISAAHQAEYCSPTCRHTMQKRRYRKRLQKKSRQTRQQR